jgi:two-component system, NtrC family, sensor histidine kinase HydH
MTRWTAFALLLVCFALAGVGVWVVHAVKRDRAALVEQFEADRLTQVEKAAQEIEAELDDVADDLRFAGRLVQAADNPGDRERELRALLAAVRHYRLVAVFDGEGRPVLTVADPITPLDQEGYAPAVVDATMSQAARQALQQDHGAIAASPPMALNEIGWLRAFATRLPSSPGAIAVLVDTAPLFRPLELVAPARQSRLLILGPHGRPTPLSDPVLAHAIDVAMPRVAGLTRLVEDMGSGRKGVLRLSEEDSAALGLGHEDAVAAHAPIPMAGGGHWSIATLSSAAGLRARSRATMLRIILASGAVAICLLGFGAYIVAVSRKAVALRERLRSADQLAHLHEKTEKILDNIPAGVIVLSEDGRVTSLNRALRERLPAARAAAAIGQPLIAALPELPGPIVDQLRMLIQAARAAGRPRSLIAEKLRLFDREGRYSIHAVPLEPLFSDARDLLVVEDVSEVHSLASQLVRAEKLATVGILGAGIAHEIGTPLGVVRARAEIINGKLGSDHPQAAGARVIMEQIDRITRTLRQLLDFSRPAPAEVVAVNVAPVAHSVAELLRFEADRRRVAIEVEVPEDLPAIAADPDELQQVLVNLVLNACDACDAGTSDARVKIAAERTPEAVRIVVVDNGGGIPEELRHRVFDPFFTTKKRGKGTGLGLTIAAQIVRNHGGRLDLEPDPAGGTRAVVLWPSSRPAPERRSHAAS